MLATDRFEYIQISLALGFVAANVGIWHGIYLQKTRASTAKSGRNLLIGSVVVEGILALLLLSVAMVISDQQIRTIIELQIRATQAESEVARLEAPRSLSLNQINIVSTAIKPFAGTPYDMSAVSGVEASFLLQLNVALSNEGKWKFVSNKFHSGFKR